MYSEKNTLAVDHHHPLRVLAPRRFPDGGAPFSDDTNEPSMNVCSRCKAPRASSGPRRARQRRSHVPSSSQPRSRRQLVNPLGDGGQITPPTAGLERPEDALDRVPTRGARPAAPGQLWLE